MAGGKEVIFVFGSNLAGRHGAGAAKFAHDNHGAVYGVGVGLTGNSYAIPTKDENIKTLPLYKIREYFEEFVSFAQDNPEKLFMLTPIGTGLAGHPKREVWAMLKYTGLPTNVVLTSSWLD
jgi:hypothetical protein